MMKSYISRLICIAVMACSVFSAEACRFTVREIGFSVLSQTEYSLLVIDSEAAVSHPAIRRMQAAAKPSNLRIVPVDPIGEAGHPWVAKASAQGITFPTAVLCDPEGRICPLFPAGCPYSLDTLEDLFNRQILQSPLRKKLLEDITSAFAYVIGIPGKDNEENRQVFGRIREDCLRIRDIMPLMPKEVSRPVQFLTMEGPAGATERIMLWSMGLDSLPDHPRAAVVYGRGRFMGQTLDTGEINDDKVYRYLAMIGADCECNLDRRWMLGTQLPLVWDETTCRQLAEQLDFDVDNPMVLAEMSRILTKEEPGVNVHTPSFTPTTIDLDKVFADTTRNSLKLSCPPPAQDHMVLHTLWTTLAALLSAAILISILIFCRKNRKG